VELSGEAKMANELPTYDLEVNALEAGVLMGMVEQAEEHVKPALSNVQRQLINLKEKLEKAEGVKKKLLPNEMLEITDKAGNRIIRPPYSWEVGGN